MVFLPWFGANATSRAQKPVPSRRIRRPSQRPGARFIYFTAWGRSSFTPQRRFTPTYPAYPSPPLLPRLPRLPPGCGYTPYTPLLCIYPIYPLALDIPRIPRIPHIPHIPRMPRMRRFTHLPLRWQLSSAIFSSNNCAKPIATSNANSTAHCARIEPASRSAAATPS